MALIHGRRLDHTGIRWENADTVLVTLDVLGIVTLYPLPEIERWLQLWFLRPAGTVWGEPGWDADIFWLLWRKNYRLAPQGWRWEPLKPLPRGKVHFYCPVCHKLKVVRYRSPAAGRIACSKSCAKAAYWQAAPQKSFHAMMSVVPSCFMRP